MSKSYKLLTNQTIKVTDFQNMITYPLVYHTCSQNTCKHDNCKVHISEYAFLNPEIQSIHPKYLEDDDYLNDQTLVCGRCAKLGVHFIANVELQVHEVQAKLCFCFCSQECADNYF